MRGPGLGSVAALGLAVLTAGPAGLALAAGPYVRPGVPAPSRGPAPDGQGTTGSAPAPSSARPSGGAGGPGLSATSLSISGKRAFDMARAADDGADDALQEGEQAFSSIRALAPDDRGPEALRTIIEAATASRGALAAYRRQAQSSAGEALQTLTRALQVSSQPAPDPFQRDSLEQQALLSAYEAAVMAARARAETERLRALLAEGRAVAAGVTLQPGVVGRAAPRTAAASAPASTGAGAGAGATKTGATGAPAATATGGVEVPNVVGARLEAASRDLAAAGLRLGATTGPRDGYVVKQTPDAGARVSARSAVTLTLSGTAASTIELAPK